MLWDAVVLAGGRGSRLGGVDKATLELDGSTLLGRTLAAVAGAARVIVVGEVDAPGAIVVREEPRFAGPAAAVGAALAEVRSPYVLLAGCDQPFLGDAVPMLLDAVTGDGVVAVDGDGRRQHLMSIVSTDALQKSVRAHASLTNMSLHALLKPLDLVEVDVPLRSTLDIDTWHDRDSAVEMGTKEQAMADVNLDEWVTQVAAELGLDGLELDTDAVLDLASVAAHAVVRPAAPLTTFLAGLAAGRAGGSPDDIRDAIARAMALCEGE